MKYIRVNKRYMKLEKTLDIKDIVTDSLMTIKTG